MDRKKGTVYRAGIYLRLSRDDAGSGNDHSWKEESNSISSQRELIHLYVQQQEDIEINAEYVDDGYSGIHFIRPGFQRMLCDIENQIINCVIVKDLSRFGRDYIETGRFLQKIFPAKYVRFIAITDRFDSTTADSNECNLILPVKNFVNDSYCRDISEKVRSHQKIMRVNGKFIGAFPVYGYQKKSGDKNKLIPDPYPAQIIKMIFEWKRYGMSCSAISTQLNELGILSPMEYKKSIGEKYETGFCTGEKTLWSAIAVKRILSNDVYTGTLTQGKSEKINYKLNQSRKKQPEEWTRVEGTHEAIIPEEIFRQVQTLLQTDSRSIQGTSSAHLFSGILFCGDCGKAMIRRVHRYHGGDRVSFICGLGNLGKGCTRHHIAENTLILRTAESIFLHLKLLVDIEEIRTEVKNWKVDYSVLQVMEQELLRIQKEQAQYKQLSRLVWCDYESGILTEKEAESFESLYRRHEKEMNHIVKKQKAFLKKMRECSASSLLNLKQFQENGNLWKELDRDTLLTFIDRILVYEDKRLLIQFRFADPWNGRE